MALIANQGSCVSFNSSTKLCTKERKFKPLVSVQLVGRLDRSILSRNHFCRRGPSSFPTEVTRLKVSAFKGTAQNDEAGGSSHGSIVSKHSVQLSYVPHDKESIAEPPETQNTSFSNSSGKENIGVSPSIQHLFKKWLIMLRMQLPSLESHDIFGAGAYQGETSEGQNGSQKKDKLLKVAWCYFLGLETAIKIPLLIFIPWYLGINLVYGAEVAKELTPLWFFGPLIVALYSKILQGLCALYVLSFRQTVRVVKNLPNYYQLAYNIVAREKLKETHSGFSQPGVDINNLNYKKLLRRTLKELKEWAGEKYLDFVEFVWPYCCGTVRLLKSSNFI